MRTALLTSVALLVAPAAVAAPADLVIWGGPVYTAVDARPKVEAVAVSHGRIAFVGSKAGAKGLVGPKTRVIDLKGAALFPGFTDSHAHLGEIGQRELTLNLEGSKSAAEVAQRLKAYISEHHSTGLVDGIGWIETGWPEGRFLQRSDLDAVAPDIPVLLHRADGHALTANTAALKAAGIDEATPSPAGGQILKGPDGKLTGMLVDNAMGLVAKIQHAPTREERIAAFKAAFRVETAYGWTGIHYMSVSWPDVPLLEEMAKQGQATLRVYNMVDAVEAGPLFADGPRATPDGRITTRGIKLYMDGA
ncbi:MAG TPA: amidohydrolase family protein, partial [Phenylobacterium sp.]|nr:amidohydrolase family protein [Phenylobacterium sp.]